VTVRHQRVNAGELLEFDVSEVIERAVLRPVSDPSVAFDVIYEDEDLIVVDKPAGLVVHPGPDIRTTHLPQGSSVVTPISSLQPSRARGSVAAGG